MIKNFIYIMFFTLFSLPVSSDINNSSANLIDITSQFKLFSEITSTSLKCEFKNGCHEIDLIEHSLLNKKIDEEYEQEMLIKELL